MNKKLLAAALGLAFAAPVFADSSNVVLYGRLHEVIDHQKVDGTAGQGVNMQDASSRIGVKGAEDLGGGLSAIFAYEFGVSATNNAGTTGRHSYVGFKSNELGTLVFGKQDGGNDSVAPLYNQAQDVAFGVSNNAGPLTTIGGGAGIMGSGVIASSASAVGSFSVVNRTQRVSNAIGYSNKFGDVTVDYRHAFSGGGTFTNLSKNGFDNPALQQTQNNIHQDEIAATYKAGAVTLGGGYQYFGYNDAVVPALTGQNNLKSVLQLVGAYDFGVAKVGLVYGRGKLENRALNAAGKDNITDYRLSTWVPITGNTGLTASYGAAEQIVNSDNRDKVAQVAAYYDFSKRTRTYFGINQAKAKPLAGGSDIKTTDVVLGLRHNF